MGEETQSANAWRIGRWIERSGFERSSGVNALRSRAPQFTLTLPLSTQEYNFNTGELSGNPMKFSGQGWARGKAESDTPSRLMP